MNQEKVVAGIDGQGQPRRLHRPFGRGATVQERRRWPPGPSQDAAQGGGRARRCGGHGPLSPGCAPEPPRRRLPGRGGQPAASPALRPGPRPTGEDRPHRCGHAGAPRPGDGPGRHGAAQRRPVPRRPRPGASTAGLGNSKKEYARPSRHSSDINREISQLEAAIRAVIVDDPEHARRDRILRSIPGVGPVTAAILCAEMPELGTLGRRQAASLWVSLPSPNIGIRRRADGRTLHGRLTLSGST